MTELTPQILALYLGCEARTNVGWMPEMIGKIALITVTKVTLNFRTFENIFNPNEVRPILRRLSDMSEGDVKDCVGDQTIQNIYIDEIAVTYEKADEMFAIDFEGPSPEQFLWLLSHSFDLFGLIDAGLAIEKKHE